MFFLANRVHLFCCVLRYISHKSENLHFEGTAKVAHKNIRLFSFCVRKPFYRRLRHHLVVIKVCISFSKIYVNFPC